MPTTERREQIEKVASEILVKHGLQKPGFNLIGFLTKQEGFRVGMQELDDDTTGLLLVNEQDPITDTGSHRLIVINSGLESDPEYLQKRRFITAHEYGHYILHKQSQEIYAHRDTTKRDTPVEKEADYFARCLLMPQELVQEVFKLWNLENASDEEKISTIARSFNVSRKKAKQRLAEVTL